ncbi:MAG: protein kinase [Myxococcaceae bacterium]
MDIGRYSVVAPLGSRPGVETFVVQHAGEQYVLRRFANVFSAPQPRVANVGKIVRLLQHPNVVPLIEMVQDGANLNVVSAFADAHSLAALTSELRRTRKPISDGLAVSIIVQAARAVEAANALADSTGKLYGMVHRDLNPGNVLITRGGVVQLADFGLGPLIGSSVLAGRVPWRIRCWAPELARQEPVDGRCDVYSLGVCLFEAVTGTTLFGTSPDTDALRALQTSTEFPRASSRRGDVKPTLDDVIARAMSVRRDDRFANVTAFRQALEACLPGARASADELSKFTKLTLYQAIKKRDAQVGVPRPPPQALGASPDAATGTVTAPLKPMLTAAKAAVVDDRAEPATMIARPSEFGPPGQDLGAPPDDESTRAVKVPAHLLALARAGSQGAPPPPPPAPLGAAEQDSTRAVQVPEFLRAAAKAASGGKPAPAPAPAPPPPAVAPLADVGDGGWDDETNVAPMPPPSAPNPALFQAAASAPRPGPAPFPFAPPPPPAAPGAVLFEPPEGATGAFPFHAPPAPRAASAAAELPPFDFPPAPSAMPEPEPEPDDVVPGVIAGTPTVDDFPHIAAAPPPFEFAPPPPPAPAGFNFPPPPGAAPTGESPFELDATDVNALPPAPAPVNSSPPRRPAFGLAPPPPPPQPRDPAQVFARPEEGSDVRLPPPKLVDAPLAEPTAPPKMERKEGEPVAAPVIAPDTPREKKEKKEKGVELPEHSYADKSLPPTLPEDMRPPKETGGRGKLIAGVVVLVVAVAIGGYALRPKGGETKEPVKPAEPVAAVVDAGLAPAALVVALNPVSARLLIDGERVSSGRNEVAAGKHVISAEAAGFSSNQLEVTLAPGETRMVELTLETIARGTLELVTTPSVTVSLEGSTTSLGQTPLSVLLPAGKVVLHVVNEKAKIDTTLTVDVKANAKTTRKVKLK